MHNDCCAANVRSSYNRRRNLSVFQRKWSYFGGAARKRANISCAGVNANPWRALWSTAWLLAFNGALAVNLAAAATPQPGTPPQPATPTASGLVAAPTLQPRFQAASGPASNQAVPPPRPWQSPQVDRLPPLDMPAAVAPHASMAVPPRASALMPPHSAMAAPPRAPAPTPAVEFPPPPYPTYQPHGSPEPVRTEPAVQSPGRKGGEGIEVSGYLRNWSTNLHLADDESDSQEQPDCNKEDKSKTEPKCEQCGEKSSDKKCSCSESSKYPTIVVTGFFQADALWFSQDAANRAAVSDVEDVASFRRARLAVKGNVAENISYMTEYDFGFPGRPSFMDMYVDIGDLPWGHFRVGLWRQPFSMEALASARELTFFERALPFAFVPFRQPGVGIYDTALDERMTWAVSGYRFRANDFGNVFGDQGYGVSTRVTGLLLTNPDCNRNTHVGFGYTWNEPSTGITEIRTPPEVGFTQLDFDVNDFPVPAFVDTGPIPSNSYQVVGFELAQSFGPLVLQSELMYATVGQRHGPNPTFPGMYVQASYVLTGEHREYNRKQGVFGGVDPKVNFGRDGWGAWEVASRWSYIDLTDANIEGGRLEDVTFGLNWYLNPHTKFQFNYIRSWLDSPINGPSACDIFGVRTQLAF